MPLMELRLDDSLNVLDDSLENKENVTFNKVKPEVHTRGISYSIEFTPENGKRQKRRESVRKSLSTTVTIRKSTGKPNESYVVEKPVMLSAQKKKNQRLTPTSVRKTVTGTRKSTQTSPASVRKSTNSHLSMSARKLIVTPTCIRRSQRRGFDQVNVGLLNRIIHNIKDMTMELEPHLTASPTLRQLYLNMDRERDRLITNRFISAALVLQRWWRRMRATRVYRTNFKIMLEKRADELRKQKQSHAAGVIQRNWHIHLIRKRLKQIVADKHQQLQHRIYCQGTFSLSNFDLDKENCPLPGFEAQMRACRNKLNPKCVSLNIWIEDVQLIQQLSLALSIRVIQLLKYEHDQRVKATVRTQAIWRGKVARTLYSKLREEMHQKVWAATCIQKYVRSFLARQMLKKLRTEHSKRQQAATKIQTFWRMYICRKSYMLSLNTMHLEQQASVQQNAARIIQRCWRAYRLHQNLNQQMARYRQAIIRIQSHVRRCLQQNQFRRMKAEQFQRQQAAISIQKHWKGYRCRLVYQGMLQERKALQDLQRRNASAIVLQKHFRRLQQQRKYDQLLNVYHQSATCIQSQWRMIVCRRQFVAKQRSQKEQAAICIQKNWRMFVHRRRYQDMVEEYRIRQTAATVIQRFWRRRRRRQQRRLQTTTKPELGRSFTISSVSHNYLNNFLSHNLLRKLRLFSNNMSLKYTKRITEILESLVEKTSTSPANCQIIANDSVFNLMINILKGCNRSEPHLRIVQAIFGVLLNLALCNQTVNYLIKANHFKNLLLHWILRYRKKQQIMLKCFTILYIVLKENNFQERPKFRDNLKRVLGRFTYQTLRRMSRGKAYHFQPCWCKDKGVRHQFISCNSAIRAFNEAPI